MNLIGRIFGTIVGAVFGIVGVALFIVVNLALMLFFVWLFTGWHPYFL